MLALSLSLAGKITFLAVFVTIVSVTSVGFRTFIGPELVVSLPWSNLHEKHRGDWKPCTEKGQEGFLCSYIDVPKDYFNASAGFATIALSKIPATVPESERLGSIFLNPGGPGGSGFDFTFRMGPALSDTVMGRYDLIGFDPRGIGRTRPKVLCFPSKLSYQLFKAGTILEHGFNVAPDPFSANGRFHLLEQHRELLALQQAEYERCAETMGDELRYMSTSTVVRDIAEMSRILEGEETPINFFGASYGTILGAYMVNMIPDKIGRVIIDGVASAPQWSNQHTYHWFYDWMKYTDTAFQWFLDSCFSVGPKGCALAHSGDEDASVIGKRLDAFLDNLYSHPIPVPMPQQPGVLLSGTARTNLYRTTNAPWSWPEISDTFAEAMAGNATNLYSMFLEPFDLHQTLRDQKDLSRVAVSCGDTPPFEDGEFPTAEFMTNKTLEVLKDVSPRFGASVMTIEPDGGCQFWPASGKVPERFSGPWNATLKTPMLIVSNTADPITPLTSGRELNALMGNSSRLLIQNSPGHCSLGSVSLCTARHYRRYFLYGELPDDELTCEIDEGYFPDEKLGDGPQVLSEEDKTLLELSRRLAQAWRGLANWGRSKLQMDIPSPAYI